MKYLYLILFILILLMAVRLFCLYRAIHLAARQMKEIEQHPEQNRQLKTDSSDGSLENLLSQINTLYSARQTERIAYQRRETEIRQEIENISHDLRTPLTSILGYLDLIGDEQTEKEERDEYLNIIRKRAKLLQSFIQDFYEISRIEADDYPLVFDSVSVQTMIKDTVVAYYHEFESKNIEVEIALEDKPCHIIADRVQFTRIINNLIQNALKYAQKDFMIKQYHRDGYCYLLFINDAGMITENDLSMIFQRFYTVDQARTTQSSGLGLTITKLLVEKMKGKIEARIEEDKFIIELRWNA